MTPFDVFSDARPSDTPSGRQRDARRLIETEQALAESERRFRSYFELDLIGVAITSPTKGWIEVNDRLCRFLGHGRERLRTMTWAELTHADDLAADEAQFERVMRGEVDGYSLEKRFVRADGRIVHASLSVRCVRKDDGAVDYFVALVQDTTELRRAQDERNALERKMFEAQKLESLGVLAGGIAHDFNNLLMGVLGNAGLARAALEDATDPGPYLAQIERATLRAAELCRQMLAYAGRGRFVLAPVDICDLVRGTLDLLRLSIRKGAKLAIDLDADMPRVFGDATQLRQIVMNLVMNASDALVEGGGAISVRGRKLHVAKRADAGEFGHGDLEVGKYALIEVRDDGCGMSAATRARMFDPFFSTKFTGRGLGLSAVLGIVKGHGGALRVVSEEHRGTVFRVFLPAAREERPPTDLAPDSPGDYAAAPTRRIALVIDDEPLVAETAASMLTHLGFEVITAHDGSSALATFREARESIGVVLLDLAMKAPDGIAVAKAIRAVDARVRIYLMSGYGEHDEIERVDAEGIDGFVPKPFRVSDLRERLGMVVDRT